MMTNNLYPVVIIAGGMATRIRPITASIPKALVEINGEPFIAHQLRLLKKQGLKQVIMSIGYLGEQVVDFVGDGSRYGLEVSYVFDGPVLLGTGGAIKKALPLVDENFFVLNGDSYLLCNYAAIQKTFDQSQKLGLMTVYRNEGKWDTSNVKFGQGRVLVYDKKIRTERMLHIDYGLEIFSRKAFATVPDNEPYDLALLFQDLIQRDELAVHEVNQRFYEIGSFAGIEELGYHLSQNGVDRIKN